MPISIHKTILLRIVSDYIGSRCSPTFRCPLNVCDANSALVLSARWARVHPVPEHSARLLRHHDFAGIGLAFGSGVLYSTKGKRKFRHEVLPLPVLRAFRSVSAAFCRFALASYVGFR